MKSSSEVAACPAEDNHASASHVLTAVIADTFDNRDDAAVADRETLAGNAADECFAGRTAV